MDQLPNLLRKGWVGPKACSAAIYSRCRHFTWHTNELHEMTVILTVVFIELSSGSSAHGRMSQHLEFEPVLIFSLHTFVHILIR